MHSIDIYNLVSWAIWKCYMYATEIFLFLLFVPILAWPSTCKDNYPWKYIIRNELVTKKRASLGKIRGLYEFCENKWQSLLCYAVIRCTPWDPTDDSINTQSLESVLDSITTYGDDEISEPSNDISNRDETNGELSNTAQPSEASLGLASNTVGLSEELLVRSSTEILNDTSSIDFCSVESAETLVRGYYSEEQSREMAVVASGIQEVVESSIVTYCTEESTTVAQCTEHSMQVSNVTDFPEELREPSLGASWTEKETHSSCLLTSNTEDQTNETYLESNSIGDLYFRISTFRNYPDENVFVTRLALQGWYYRGLHNDTKCHKCHQTHAGWKKNDDPRQFHGTECPMASLQRSPVGMRSLKKAVNEDGKQQKGNTFSTQHEAQEKTLTNSKTKGCKTTNENSEQELSFRNDDGTVSGDFGSEGATSLPLPSYPKTFDHPPDVVFRTYSPPSQTQKVPGTPVKSDPKRRNSNIPKYPLFSSLAERKKSFNRRSEGFGDMMHTYGLMAEAGFFYILEQNGVRCFFCGGALRNWKSDDDPWIEHARLFKDCSFLEQEKGREFIEQIDKLKKEKEIQRNQQIDTKQSTTKTDKKHMTAQGKIVTLPSDASNDASSSKNNGNVTADLTSDEERKSTLCVMCSDNNVANPFLPCGHLTYCEDCYPAMRKCPICR